MWINVDHPGAARCLCSRLGPFLMGYVAQRKLGTGALIMNYNGQPFTRGQKLGPALSALFLLLGPTTLPAGSTPLPIAPSNRNAPPPICSSHYW